MILLFLILQVTLIAAAILFIIRPFFLSDNRKPDMNNSNYNLHEQHTRLIESLHDLDFDHRTEKITTEDYTTARNNIINEGINLLRKIDDTHEI